MIEAVDLAELEVLRLEVYGVGVRGARVGAGAEVRWATPQVACDGGLGAICVLKVLGGSRDPSCPSHDPVVGSYNPGSEVLSGESGCIDSACPLKSGLVGTQALMMQGGVVVGWGGGGVGGGGRCWGTGGCGGRVPVGRDAAADSTEQEEEDVSHHWSLGVGGLPLPLLSPSGLVPWSGSLVQVFPCS